MRLFTSLSGNNNTRWKNPVYDSLIESAAREWKTEKRIQLYDQAQKILSEADLPIVPLFTSAESTVLNSRFTGLEYNSMGRLVLRHVKPRNEPIGSRQ
jgi:oligopeptide transport system substrate-binding protein